MTHRNVIVEADGGSRGNPGPAAYGALLKDADTGELIAERGETIGRATNNVAEYRGLIAGLELAAEHAPEADIAAIRQPTLVASGVDDDDNGSAADLAALLPHGTLVELPGNHMSAVTKPELGEAVAKFLSS